MSYATPTFFRGFGLPPDSLEGVGDPVIQQHLSAGTVQIERRLRGRNIPVPVTGQAALDLAPEECKLAAYSLLTLYRGVPRDDPSVAGYREMAKEAIAEIDAIASGLLNGGTDDVSPTGGGMTTAYGPVDALGYDEPDWYPACR